MKKNYFGADFKKILIFSPLLISLLSFGQQSSNTAISNNNIWKNVQFGGGLGVNIGTGFTEITVAPSAIYNLNSYFSLGAGLQYGYVSSKNAYTSTVYGGSLIALINPIQEIQLSAELEEVNINTTYNNTDTKTSFWTTSLYLGAGYRTGNVTIGARYNVLFDKNKSYNNNGFLPFVRVYF